MPEVQINWPTWNQIINERFVPLIDNREQKSPGMSILGLLNLWICLIQ